MDRDIDPREASQKLVALWQRTGNANRSFISEVFRSMALHAEAKPLVRWLDEHGFRLCLMSGSMDGYVRAVSERLGITDWFSNGKLLFDERGDLVNLEYWPDQSERKVQHLKELSVRIGVAKTEIVTIGDGQNDLGLFEATGRGILVSESPHPDAKRSAWKVVPRLSDVPLALS